MFEVAQTARNDCQWPSTENSICTGMIKNIFSIKSENQDEGTQEYQQEAETEKKRNLCGLTREYFSIL
jgi:hypothetical protein